MGLFSLKETCCVCEKEVGINRYLVGNERWLCPSCHTVAFKKRPGMFGLNEMSTEELKDLILPEFEKAALERKELDDEIAEFESHNPKKIEKYLWICEETGQFAIPECDSRCGIFNKNLPIMRFSTYPIDSGK